MADIYLLDTNVIRALADPGSAGHEAAVEHFQRAGDQIVLLPAPAVGEIEFGMNKAPDIRPEKRQEIRQFISRFDQLAFDEHCVTPYAAVRAEIWRQHGTPKSGRPHAHKEKRPEDLLEKHTGAHLGIDEPDLYIASIALAGNLVLVTNDGMKGIREAAEEVHRRGEFPCRLRVVNWLDAAA
jgi:predicted nucleic acid-binding protein